MYTTRHAIYEKHRIAITRIRLSHRLKVETGRWSRIPREERLCACGDIQTETHVLINCLLSADLRLTYPRLNFNTVSSLMETDNLTQLGNYCHDILKLFENQ